MNKKLSTRKKAFSIIERVLALVLMVLAILWAINRLSLMIFTKIGEWYNYAFVIGIGILSAIVGMLLVKGLLSLFFAHKRFEPPNRDIEV